MGEPVPVLGSVRGLVLVLTHGLRFRRTRDPGPNGRCPTRRPGPQLPGLEQHDVEVEIVVGVDGEVTQLPPPASCLAALEWHRPGPAGCASAPLRQQTLGARESRLPRPPARVRAASQSARVVAHVGRVAQQIDRLQVGVQQQPGRDHVKTHRSIHRPNASSAITHLSPRIPRFLLHPPCRLPRARLMRGRNRHPSTTTSRKLALQLSRPRSRALTHSCCERHIYFGALFALMQPYPALGQQGLLAI